MYKIKDWQCFEIEQTQSTNDEIKKYCTERGQKIVLRTNRQTAGRGRRGRQWICMEGNLFFSMALEFDVLRAGDLVIMSSLSLLQTIADFNPDAQLQIKWPNDVLLYEAKVSGILLEKAQENYMIIGIGVNIVAAPQENDLIYKATSLKQHAINTDAKTFMDSYIRHFESNLEAYAAFKTKEIFTTWKSHLKGIGSKIKIRQEKGEMNGIFLGVDTNANLLLKTQDKIQKITVGDIFYCKVNE